VPLWRRRLRQILYVLLRAVGVRSVRIRVRGRPLWIDLRDKTLGRYFWVFRTYEPFEADLLERATQSGMTVVDLGANVGYLTVLLGHRVGPTGRVVSFEPDPTNFALLRRSVEANGLANVTCEQAAVMEKSAQASLYLSEVNFGDHRVFEGKDDERFNAGAARNKVQIRAVSLDEYLGKAGLTPGLIKMDIQGAEVAALSGMRRTLANPDLILFCEYWPHGLRRFGTEPRRFMDALIEAGLDLYEIDEESRSLLQVDFEELAERYPEHGLANLVCCHPDRAKRLLETLGLPVGGRGQPPARAGAPRAT
jgi:FkbM family methyltransferase